MSKINDLITELCTNEGEYRKYGQVFEIRTGKGITTKDASDDGLYPIISGGTTPMGYYNEYNRVENTVTISRVGVNAGYVSYIREKFYLNDKCFSIIPVANYVDKLLPKFVYYYTKNIENNIMKLQSEGGVPTINTEKVSNLLILIPPIEVQEQIVRILDKFSDLEVKLEAELEARKKQYEFWSKKIFDIDNCEWKTTEESFSVITDYVANGSFKSIADNVTYKSEKDYAVLLRTVDYSNSFNQDKFIYIDEHAYNFLEKSKLFGGEIIINNIGAGVGTTFLCPKLNMPMSLAPNAIMMRTPNNKFYYYWFNSKSGQESIDSVVAKSAMPKFNKTGFRKLLVPVPSLEEQEKIVKILDKFDKLINESIPAEIELRRKQYEYYRNKLLSFEELKEND